MKSLYLILNIGSLIIPFLYSFHYKMNFVKNWNVLLSSILIAIPFLIWDAFFTYYGIWGFNSNYYLGITLFKMPIEEWLFFLCIPYASLFIYFSLQHLFPEVYLSKKTTQMITLILIGIAIVILFKYYNRWYTIINFICFFILMLYAFFYKINELQTFYIAFVLILIPFFLVNGILTGSFICNHVVWYNSTEIIGFRIGTIPFEDLFYCFTMLFSNLLILKKLEND